MQKFKVRVFTTITCPHCYTLKKFLKDKGVEFEEIDVSQDEKAQEEMVKKSGSLVVPTIEINGKIVVGFDKEKILELLNLKE